MTHVARGYIRRIHDYLWRWRAVIETGDVSTRWSCVTWTFKGAERRARAAEKRIGMSVDWKVALK